MRYFYALLLLGLLAACGGNNNNNAAPVTPAPAPPPPPPNAVFQVSAVNLTNAQPLSPLAAVIHDTAFRAFTIGEPASLELEVLAEGGDNGDFLAAIDGRAEASAGGPLGPGASDSLELELDGDDTGGTLLTVMSMLVNTNDAFTGLNAVDVSALAVGDRVTFMSVAYDAGTEANSEAAGTIPGPADGGEGFDSARDDISDQVTMHGGVVGSDDGLGSSILSQSHRFDNPVARFTVTRTQ